MLSNVTKSADVLRGNTQMQDLWLEVEKETSAWHKPNIAPKQIQEAERLGRRLNELERQEELARLCTMRQQRTNFYVSESAGKLQRAKTDMSKSERKTVRDRLTKRTAACSTVRPKSPTNLGHVLATGEHAVTSPVLQPIKSPKSRAMVSSPNSMQRTRTQSKFEGLTMRDFSAEWAPSFDYKPAKQDKPWESLEGFSQSTRTLERRKMDPFADINSFHGNAYSAKSVLDHSAHVRPLDVKGQLGAGPVQKWKETLREDFANDNDNASSNMFARRSPAAHALACSPSPLGRDEADVTAPVLCPAGMTQCSMRSATPCKTPRRSRRSSRCASNAHASPLARRGGL